MIAVFKGWGSFLRKNNMSLLKSACQEEGRRQRAAQYREKNALGQRTALALKEIREAAGLSKSDMARRSTWPEHKITALEIPDGTMPSSEDILGFLKICGATSLTIDFSGLL